MNYGILGAGVIARDFAKAATCQKARAAGIQVAAVAARDGGRAQAFAGEFGIQTAYEGYDALLADPAVDAVYIAVTHNFHTQLTEKAILAGKAVLCEKPFAIGGAQAEQTVALAREKKVLVMEAMWTRCLPSVLRAKEWVAQGEIGKVRLIEASFGFYSERDSQSRLYNPETAGGALLDVGVYPIAFAMDFAGGKPLNICGAMGMGPTGVDEVNAMTMLFEGGAVASLSSGVRVATSQGATVYGEKGSIHLPLYWGGHRAVLRDNKGAELACFIGENHTRDQGFVYQVLHFAQLFEEGKTESPRMPLADTLACAHMCDRLFTSAAKTQIP